MPQFARSGRARISIRRPRAMGECDQCSGWVNHADMIHQMQWAGNKLIDTGLLVCRSCLDKPQDQYRTIILPPDPRPIVNPRQSPNVTGYRPTFAEVPRPYGFADYGTDAYGTWLQENPTGPTSPDNRTFTQLIVGGASLPPYVPLAKYEVLEKVAALTAIPIPPQIIDRSVKITTQNRSFPLFGTQPTRGWILFYNPTNPQAQVALSPPTPPLPAGSMSVTWGNIQNLILGPGEAYFACVDQGLGPCYQGAMAVVGLIPGMDFWAWEAGYPKLWLTDDDGRLITDDFGQAIPLDRYSVQPESYFVNAGGLLQVFNAYGWPSSAPSGGGVWNDHAMAKVGPGSAPRNGMEPVFLATTTPLELLVLGGNDLPWTLPKGKGQLWNPGGVAGGQIGVTNP